MHLSEGIRNQPNGTKVPSNRIDGNVTVLVQLRCNSTMDEIFLHAQSLLGALRAPAGRFAPG